MGQRIIAANLAVLAFAVMGFSITQGPTYGHTGNTGLATCKPNARVCPACKNCKYCGHCSKRGGTCSVERC